MREPVPGEPAPRPPIDDATATAEETYDDVVTTGAVDPELDAVLTQMRELFAGADSYGERARVSRLMYTDADGSLRSRAHQLRPLSDQADPG